MSMSAILTVAGMYDYRDDVFDELVLPVPPANAEAIGLSAGQLLAAWTIDRADFIQFLCLKTMGMSLAIPDADFLKKAVGVWSRTHIHEWQLLFNTQFYRFNPLWNKDGKITETGQDARTGSGSSTNTGEMDGGNTSTTFTHGYNDGSQIHEDDNLSWTHAGKEKGTVYSDTTNTINSETEDNLSYNHTTTEQGNIGVTKSTELIDDYRKTALFSIEEYIADEFCKHFCLMLW